MPRVPYQPYSDVAPSGANVSIATPPEAFGVGVARATEGLGREVEQAGDKLFNRAIAFQHLDNRATADNYLTGYTEDVDKERIDFQSKEGINAKNDLENHYARLNAIREGWQQKAADNPEVQRLFNSESRSLQVRIKGASATHTASEFKKYQDSTADANIKRIYDEVGMFPKDDVMFSNKLKELEAAVNEKAYWRGRDAATAQQDFYEFRSALASKRVDSLSKTDPKAAEKMNDDFAKNGYIRGDDVGKTLDKVQQKLYTVGAQIDASGQISGSNLRLGSGKVSDAQASMAISSVETGGEKGDPYKALGIQTKHGRALGKYQVMEEFLPEFLREAGMKSMTPEEFLKSPEAQEQLFKIRFRALQEKYGSFNEAARHWIGTGAADGLGTTPQRYIEKVNAALAGNTSLGDHRANGAQIAEEVAPGDQLYKMHVDNAIITLFNKNQSEVRDTNYRTMDTLRGLMAGIDMPDGKRPTTLAELQSTPEGESAWDKATKTQRAWILNVGLPNNTKADHIFTDESFKEYSALRGRGYSNDPQDRQAFMDTPYEDILAKPWPNAKKTEIIDMQRKMRNQIEGNPHMNKFLQVNAGQMAGVVDKKTDPEDYFQFLGVAHDQIYALQQERKGAPLKDEDYTKIGRDMLYQRMEKGWFGREVPGEPAYKAKPTEEEADRIRKLPDWGGKIPSDYWVNRYYLQQTFTPSKGEAKPATKEPTKPPPPSITDKLVQALDEYGRTRKPLMEEQEKRGAEIEETIRKQQEELLTRRSLSSKAKAQVP